MTSDQCESGCSSPAVVVIGGVALCQKCADEMFDRAVTREPSP